MISQNHPLRVEERRIFSYTMDIGLLQYLFFSVYSQMPVQVTKDSHTEMMVSMLIR